MLVCSEFYICLSKKDGVVHFLPHMTSTPSVSRTMRRIISDGSVMTVSLSGVAQYPGIEVVNVASIRQGVIKQIVPQSLWGGLVKDQLL